MDISITSRIPDQATAYHYATQAVESHDRQWELFRAIREHIEGKKPIDPSKLEKRGLSWASNFNFGKARSQIEKNTIERVKKISDALMLGMPELCSKGLMDSNPELYQMLEDPANRLLVSSIVGYCFFEAIEEEGNLYSLLNDAEYNSYTYGFAPVEWRDKGWTPTVIPVTRIAFPPGAEAEDLDMWIVFRSEKAEYLYRTLDRITAKREKNDKAAQEYLDGLSTNKPPKINIYWNEEKLKKILVSLLGIKDQNNKPFEEWGDVAPLYESRRGYVVSQTADLNIAAIYVKELDGSITEIFIPWSPKTENQQKDANVGNKVDDGRYILYRRNHSDKTTDDLIQIIVDSGLTETGEIHSFRGAGKIATENSIRYNRLRNGLTDKSTLVGMPVFEQPSTQTKNKFKITMSQGFAMVPAGYNMLEKQPSFDINSHLQIIGHENREFNDVASHFQENATGKLSSRPTSDEIQLARQEVMRIRSAKDKVSLRGYANVFYNIFKKMQITLSEKDKGYAAQKKFFRLVRESLSVIKDDSDITTLIKHSYGLNIDLINTEISALQMALQLSETPFARNRIRRMMLISQGFSIREVNNYVPINMDKYHAFNDDRVALIEQDIFWNSNEVVISDSDDHMVHLRHHNDKINQIFERVRQGQLDVIQAYDYTVRLYSHSMEHIGMLGEDPVLSGNAEEYMDQFRQHKQVIGQLAYARNKAIQAQQEAAQYNNPQISPKDAHDMRLKQEQAVAQEQRNQFKAAVRGEQRQQEIENKHQERMREIELKHQADLEKQRNQR